MMRHLFRLCLLLCIGLPAMAQKSANELHFTSSQQQLITVYKGTIFVNGNKAFIFHDDIINYKSRRNRLIENGKSVFLFLEVNGSPNKNRLYVFNIDHSLADFCSECHQFGCKRPGPATVTWNLGAAI